MTGLRKLWVFLQKIDKEVGVPEDTAQATPPQFERSRARTHPPNRPSTDACRCQSEPATGLPPESSTSLRTSVAGLCTPEEALTIRGGFGDPSREESYLSPARKSAIAIAKLEQHTRPVRVWRNGWPCSAVARADRRSSPVHELASAGQPRPRCLRPEIPLPRIAPVKSRRSGPNSVCGGEAKFAGNEDSF